MRIESIEIRNFRGISNLSMSNLSDMVIVAGQNGSGKSCIFDAIRLLKSVQGGYQHNEWHQWMNEFNIPIQGDSDSVEKLLADTEIPLYMECFFALSESERLFLENEHRSLLKQKLMSSRFPHAYVWGAAEFHMLTPEAREAEPEIDKQVEHFSSKLIDELKAETFKAYLEISKNTQTKTSTSLVLQLLFGTYKPGVVGLIDYHGPQRFFGREDTKGLNLNLQARDERQRDFALYNYGSKYNNIKSELAASFVRDLIAKESNATCNDDLPLSKTLEILFETFFPHKTFLGVQSGPDGSLSFPVQINGTISHDLDDLSSGEKEIIYGYLRMRNSAPKNSIILLDEPELHLNPNLTRHLPTFYHDHLAKNLSNQVWLITHSDSLIRDGVGNSRLKIFHMVPSRYLSGGESQVKELSQASDLDLLLTDLVGDLASYRPGGKILVLEGDSEGQFDKKMLQYLFPSLSEKFNIISGTNKNSVRKLSGLLDEVSTTGPLPYQVFSITDKDSLINPKVDLITGKHYEWDSYHIENYLLQENYVRKAIETATLTESTSIDVVGQLKSAAELVINKVVAHEMRILAHTSFSELLDFGFGPTDRIADLLAERIESYSKNSQSLINEKLNFNNLREKENELRAHYLNSLTSDLWMKILPGREILCRFVNIIGLSLNYQSFRNIILTEMRSDGYKPPSMTTVVDAILSDTI